MSLMNVKNKYLNSGVFWAGVIQFLTTKELIYQQDSKEQQKILNLKFLSFFFLMNVAPHASLYCLFSIIAFYFHVANGSLGGISNSRQEGSHQDDC